MSGTTELEPDRARITSWVHEHGSAVRGYVLALLRRDDLADDLVQEVFRRAWQARQRYEENGTAKAYLMRIADRLVCDLARQNRREIVVDDDAWRELEPFDIGQDPKDAVAHDEARVALHLALDRLSPSQRRALLLRYYGDLSFQEIADAMECPLATALSHCRRGLLAMRKNMRDASDE